MFMRVVVQESRETGKQGHGRYQRLVLGQLLPSHWD